jgi:hypothetical protein
MVNKGATVASVRLINAKNQSVVAPKREIARRARGALNERHKAAGKLPKASGKSRQSKHFHPRKVLGALVQVSVPRRVASASVA